MPREWRGPDLNRRHHGFQPCALPTELPRKGGQCSDLRPLDRGRAMRHRDRGTSAFRVVDEVRHEHDTKLAPSRHTMAATVIEGGFLPPWGPWTCCPAR